jgi:hypothetical protein
MLTRWDSFKRTLPHQAQPFAKRNWGSPLHSVCSYQAKMKPALAHHLVKVFSKPGDIVVDPFSGSGTIPFEACLMGRKGYGMDIALLGVALTNAKVMRADFDKVAQLLNDLGDWLRHKPALAATQASVTDIKFNGPLRDYFHPDTFEEVLSARDFFAKRREDTPEWHLTMACMLHILHGNRPYALSRNSHPITPYAPTGEYIYKSVLERLTTKVNRSLAVMPPPEFVEGKCFQADICQPWPEELKEIDSIITSPPFFDSTRFYMTNWMRYWFCGWGKSDFETEPENFVEITQKRSLKIYDSIFQRFEDRLRTGGLAVMHLGLSHKCDMAKELAELAKGRLTVLDAYTESVEHCESHGIRDKGTVTGHQYLILQKP